MTTRPVSNSRRAKVRISLLTLLLLLSAGALVAGIYRAREENLRLQAELAPLEAENAALRAELGVLTIDDPDMVYAIRMPDLAEDLWRYRVFLPDAGRYYVAAQANKLPTGDLRPTFGGEPPQGAAINTRIKSSRSQRGGRQVGMSLGPGEIVVSVRLDTNDQGETAFTLSAGRPGEEAKTGSTIRSDPDEWPAILTDPRGSRGLISRGIGGISKISQASLVADHLPVVLLDYRVMQGGVTSSRDSDEGILVWIGRADEHDKSE